MTDRNRSSKSNEDLTKKISHSIFVTNFPDSVTSRDLWRECNAFGTVVDVFIPFKKSKAGKRFAFVRFIKVFNLDRLVKNLCRWGLGGINCFADVNVLYLGGLWVMLEFNKEESKSKLMQHTGVKSWFHTIQDVTHDFVCDERIVWVDIEGIPLYAWSRETFSRIGNKWGETLDIEDTNETSFGRKRVHQTKHPVSILKLFKIIVKGKVYMVRAKELFMWNSIFLAHKKVVYFSDDESIHGEENNVAQQNHNEGSGDDDSEVEGVAETIFDNNSDSFMDSSGDKDKQQSEDPFGIYDILKKKKNCGEKCDSSTSLSHPHGFTPEPF
ncbi:RNA-directed DNA polymerase, eukaryota [Tanacetum coccineum]